MPNRGISIKFNSKFMPKEMNIDLAIEKGLRKYVSTAHEAGVFLTPVSELPGPPPADTGEELYSKELGDLAWVFSMIKSNPVDIGGWW